MHPCSAESFRKREGLQALGPCRNMDSLLYVGGADDDDDDDDEEEEEEVQAEEAEEEAKAAASAPKQVDFAALQRAGYASSSLTSTDTYNRLTKEEEATKPSLPELSGANLKDSDRLRVYFSGTTSDAFSGITDHPNIVVALLQFVNRCKILRH